MRTMKKKKTSEIEKGKAIEVDPKELDVEVASERPNLTLVAFPPGVLAFKESSSFLKKADDLLFSTDNEFLNGKKTEEVVNDCILSAFKAIQMQLYLKHRFVASRERYAKL
ncbi:hypothetical protein Dsin_011115 [Dipteronia sinensis]|uniref:Uncharacterized protein n=1 Tax=Dipteronia sinensis TaxID=43782 RepID=A0AAE0AUG2_9ROSI|nr:hypothetical protein Dsin_011115 [Dipteronia sinensis]